MDAVGASNDVVGGVELTVLDDFTGIDDTLVKGQTVTLSAEQALRYVRTRYGMEDSSNSARMARQQQYINAWYDQVTQKINADENFLLELVDTMDDHVVYDSSDRKLLKFAEEYNNYEFLGIRELEGQSRVGDEFVEFHVNKDAALETVIELFYVPKN
jgi:anionic cell wall polymer biosynthesis LytR-Cps2A-Psr (LCP) family protein